MKSILEFLQKISLSESDKKQVRLAEKAIEKFLSLEEKNLLLNKQNKELVAKNKSISEKNAHLVQQIKLLREEIDTRCGDKADDKVILDSQAKKILQLMAKKTIITDHELAETLKENIAIIQDYLSKLFFHGFVHASLHVRHMFQQRIPDQFSITEDGKEYLKNHC